MKLHEISQNTALFDALKASGWIGPENQMLLENYMARFATDCFSAVLECQLWSDIEVAKIISQFLDVDFVSDSSELKIELSEELLLHWPYSKAHQFLAAPCFNGSQLFLGLVDPWFPSLVAMVKTELKYLDSPIVIVPRGTMRHIIHRDYPAFTQLRS